MAERAAVIVSLHADGFTCEQIGARLGISKRRVWRILKRAITFAIIEEMIDDSVEV